MHGTWNQQSAFVRPRSLLRSYLRDHIDAPIGYLKFRWRGANTHGSRIRAGAQLAGFLSEAFAKYPDYEHAIVCHSHGGTVAQYALRRLPSIVREEKRAYCIYIGTPFIDCPPDAAAELDKVLDLASAWYGQLKAGTSVNGRFYSWISYLGLAVIAFGIAGLRGGEKQAFESTFLGVYAALVAAMWISLAFIVRFGSRARKLAAELRAYPLPLPQLCLRMAGDEPFWILRGFTEPIGALSAWQGKLRFGLLSVAAVGIVVGLLLMFVALLGNIWAPLEGLLVPGIVVAGAGSAAVFAALLLQVVNGFFGNLITSHPGALGRDGWAAAGWFLRYKITTVPPGACVEEQVYRPADLEGIPQGLFLQHSILYSSTTSLDRMARFLCRHTGFPYKG